MLVPSDAPSAYGGRDGGRPRGRTGPAAAAALAALLGAGCASAYAAFLPEREIPECARWLEEAEAFPARVVRERAGTAGGRPCGIEIEERGTGEGGRVVVLLHGVLSDRRTWRYMTGRLAAACDVLLVDLPGCGGSDRPDPADLGPRGYDPDALAAAVLAALRGRLASRREAPRVTLVGHSLGSAVVLRALGSRDLAEGFADVLDLVDGAVLFSPPDCSYAKRDPVFERIASVGGLEIAVGNALGLVHEQVADSVRWGVEAPAATPREEVDRIWEILSDPQRRAAAQSMLRNAVPFTGDLRPDWDRIDALEEDLARVRVPCLVVCGGRDDAVPEALSFKLARQLPDARLRVFSRSGHSLPTERPEECADLVLGFAETGGEGWVAYEETRGAPAAAPRREPAGAAQGVRP